MQQNIFESLVSRQSFKSKSAINDKISLKISADNRTLNGLEKNDMNVERKMKCLSNDRNNKQQQQQEQKPYEQYEQQQQQQQQQRRVERDVDRIDVRDIEVCSISVSSNCNSDQDMTPVATPIATPSATPSTAGTITPNSASSSSSTRQRGSQSDGHGHGHEQSVQQRTNNNSTSDSNNHNNNNNIIRSNNSINNHDKSKSDINEQNDKKRKDTAAAAAASRTPTKSSPTTTSPSPAGPLSSFRSKSEIIVPYSFRDKLYASILSPHGIPFQTVLSDEEYVKEIDSKSPAWKNQMGWYISGGNSPEGSPEAFLGCNTSVGFYPVFTPVDLAPLEATGGSILPHYSSSPESTIESLKTRLNQDQSSSFMKNEQYVRSSPVPFKDQGLNGFLDYKILTSLNLK
jgi:hypothetical protein